MLLLYDVILSIIQILQRLSYIIVKNIFGHIGGKDIKNLKKYYFRTSKLHTFSHEIQNTINETRNTINATRNTINETRHERLTATFYQQDDVVQLAQQLLGKVLVTRFGGIRTAGRITETEAYRGADDRACHAFGYKRTARTEVMFRAGGHAYIYLCYGIHHLFNVVTSAEGIPNAVLIRAIEPLEGMAHMYQRRHRKQTDRPYPTLTNGPGALAQALGFHSSMSGQNMLDADTPFWLEDDGFLPTQINSGPRIGVDYAGECAAWPWRFWIRNA
jgi:DNA-3-methyladenine glycosylase